MISLHFVPLYSILNSPDLLAIFFALISDFNIKGFWGFQSERESTSGLNI